MKTYGLCNPSLLINPLTEIKEDICSVLETLDEPLCSSQILDDTEDLLACLNSQDLLDDEDDVQDDDESKITEESVFSSCPISLENSPCSVDEETLTCTDASITNQQSLYLSQTLSLNEDRVDGQTTVAHNKNPPSQPFGLTKNGGGEDPLSIEGITHEDSKQNPSTPSLLIQETVLKDTSTGNQSFMSQSLFSTEEGRTIEEGNDDFQTLGDFPRDEEADLTASSPSLMLDIPSIQIEDFDGDGDVIVENVFVTGIEQEINHLMEEENESTQGVQTKLKKIMVSSVMFRDFLRKMFLVSISLDLNL